MSVHVTDWLTAIVHESVLNKMRLSLYMQCPIRVRKPRYHFDPDMTPKIITRYYLLQLKMRLDLLCVHIWQHVRFCQHRRGGVSLVMCDVTLSLSSLSWPWETELFLLPSCSLAPASARRQIQVKKFVDSCDVTLFCPRSLGTVLPRVCGEESASGLDSL